MAARFSGGWPFGRIIGVGLLIVGLFSLLAIGVGGTALADLSSARDRVVTTLDPAAAGAAQLEVELLNQETGVRGYLLTADPSFLTPYKAAQESLDQQLNQLERTVRLEGGRGEVLLALEGIAPFVADHVTPLLLVLVTAAVNCTVPPDCSVVFAGLNTTPTTADWETLIWNGDAPDNPLESTT